MAKSNPRYECSSPTCNAKITRNQLRFSNGICIYCKTPMKHSEWMGGQQATLAQLLRLPESLDSELREFAREYEYDVHELIRAAVALKLQNWRDSPDRDKAIKNDLVYTKLSTP